MLQRASKLVVDQVEAKQTDKLPCQRSSKSVFAFANMLSHNTIPGRKNVADVFKETLFNPNAPKRNGQANLKL